MPRHTDHFFSHRETFEEMAGLTFEEKKAKGTLYQKPPERVVEAAEHDRPFRPGNPAKKGPIKGTIDKFPEWEKDPVFQKKGRVVFPEDAPPGWKATYRER